MGGLFEGLENTTGSGLIRGLVGLTSLRDIEGGGGLAEGLESLVLGGGSLDKPLSASGRLTAR
jgi:hypothetical protein